MTTTKTFKVEFNEYWSYDKEDGCRNFMTVASKDGEQAIQKVKTHILAQSFKDDDNPKIVHTCIKFELIGLELLAELDL